MHSRHAPSCRALPWGWVCGRGTSHHAISEPFLPWAGPAVWGGAEEQARGRTDPWAGWQIGGLMAQARSRMQSATLETLTEASAAPACDAPSPALAAAEPAIVGFARGQHPAVSRGAPP